MQRKRLPIGIQTFAKIREDDACYYVDKTPLALRLIAQGTHFFLSRPRRFGKSLFLDTLKELFEGNEALFKGLYAEKHWDWSVKYPVVRISFGGGVTRSAQELEDQIDSHLRRFETANQLAVVDKTLAERFRSLILHLVQTHNQRVVVLIDEYDKPILDNIEQREIALETRETLKDFYSVIKDADAYIRFAFLTGVSKFSKVSLFSGLNNLQDITLDARYSTICGYTDQDVDSVFAAELEGLDRSEIKRWYNGYNWLGESVYNPFDLLLLFDHRTFRPWWFETGTPTFLVKLLTQRGFFTPDLANLQTGEQLISSFDVDAIKSEALLFQTGYLTIHDVQQPILGHWVYTLGYPNREVESSLNASLLEGLGVDSSKGFENRIKLITLLRQQNIPAMRDLFHAFFASIPHDWYRNSPIAQYEGYWASIFYSHFAALGLDIKLEDATNHGRIDMTVCFEGHVYLFEFKVVELVPEGKALQQLKDKRYADKYRADGPVHLIGVEFSKDTRNIVGFEVEEQVG
ncbi:Protein of unknown function DUF1703 [gamma proteobacterium HdN1]|nr:Protein of unknown function DUF1703 [gamma proteobacterium HdN1]